MQPEMGSSRDGTYVVVEIGIRDRNPIARMGNIEQPIVVVFPVGHIGREVAVVDPDISRVLKADSVASRNLRDLHIPDNDVLAALDM